MNDHLSTIALAPAVKSRVLVVEDDPVCAISVKRVLEAEGLHVDHVIDGMDACTRLQESDYALVILDVLLPWKNGFDLLQSIRQQASHACLPVIMLTGMRKREDIDRGAALGADEYVLKPFDPSELLVRVRRLLRREGG